MRTLIAVVAACLTVTSLQAQPTPTLKQLNDQYQKARDQAREVLNKDIAKHRKAILDGREKPEKKTFLVNQLDREREAFLDKNELPTSDLMLKPVLKYLLANRKARLPLAAAYSKAIAKALKDNDIAKANSLTMEKAALDKQAGGLGKFVQGSEWDGTRHGLKANVTFSLRVEKLEANTFRGEVWMDDRYVGMEVNGEIDGNTITFQTLKMLKGQARNLKFTGFVFEGRLVAEVGGIATDGKAATGMISLKVK